MCSAGGQECMGQRKASPHFTDTSQSLNGLSIEVTITEVQYVLYVLHIYII